MKVCMLISLFFLGISNGWAIDSCMGPNNSVACPQKGACDGYVVRKGGAYQCENSGGYGGSGTCLAVHPCKNSS